MNIRWVKPYLGTSSALAENRSENIHILDVRALVDKAGNSSEQIRQKIDEGVGCLREGKQLIVCCDYGISRSNAIAAGILSVFENISFNEALSEVIATTGEQEIKLSVADAVRNALQHDNTHSKTQFAPRLLITGGNGFVGRTLIPMLSKEYEVYAPNRAEIDLTSGTGALDLFVKKNSISHILHLANPRVYVSNKGMGETLSMLRNILEVCVSNNTFLIYPSTWEVYSGYQSSGMLANENLPFNPKGPYGETKWLCEALIEHFRRTESVRCTVLRSSPLYGRLADRPKFIWTFQTKARDNALIQTHKFQNGYPHLDLMHVSDFCNAISKALKKECAVDINVGTGRLLSTWDVAHILCAKLESRSRIEAVDIDGYAPNIAMDISRAKKILEWVPTVAFEDGIVELLAEVERRERTQ